MVQEFRKVIAREKFKLSKDQQNTLTNFILRAGNVVKVKSRFRVIEEDRSDDVVLRTAYDGKAEYVVSGDEHLLSLKEFKGIRIVTVAQMLELLEQRHYD